MARPNSEHCNTNFCLVLANQILESEISKGSNFVASPLSLHVMLSLAAAGTKGRTLEQMLHILQAPSASDLILSSSRILDLTSKVQEGSESLGNGGPSLSFVNGAWLDRQFNLKPSFEAIVKSTYKAEIKNVDFVFKPKEAADEVNSWAETSSKGLIKNLVPYDAINCDTVLIVANALYFKGTWGQKFDPSKTEARDFHLLNGETVRVPFMTTHSSVRLHSYRCFDGVKVLRIPYQNGQDPRRFSMYFFLPDKKDGLLSLIQNVKSNPNVLNQRFDLIEDKLTNFWIPKFKFSFEFEASKTMKEMGIVKLFQRGELTEIVDCHAASNKLVVSTIHHKAFIEVNEEGTEAAASTAIVSEMLCSRLYPSFVADHPFMFMIREETHNVVFFVGAVLNPLVES